MQQIDWSNTVTTWHFNPDNVREPQIVFNNTGVAYGSAPGFDGTPQDFSPKNFAPNASNAGLPYTWTQVHLDQFNVGAGAKEVILTGDAGLSGAHMWTGGIYLWFRKPGSMWSKARSFYCGYTGNFTIHVPVGLVNGAPTIEMAWGLVGLDPINWGTGNAPNDTAWLNMVLSGWGE